MGCLCGKNSTSLDNISAMEEVREGTNIEIYSGKNEFKLYAVRNDEIHSKISIPKCYIEGKHCTIHTSNDVEIKVEGTILTLSEGTESSNVLQEDDTDCATHSQKIDSPTNQKNIIPILKSIDAKQKQDLIKEVNLIGVVPDLMKKCRISHHISPYEFYVTLNGNITCHQFIKDEANSSISGPFRMAPICELRLQCLIAEGEFAGSRGVISKVEDEKVTVKLLDVGKDIVVEKEMLAGIPEKIDFSHIPALAIKCCLHRCKNNTKEVTDSLKYMFETESNTTVHFIGFKHDSWHVSLIRTSDILVKEFEPIFMALGYAPQPKLQSCTAYIGYVDVENRQLWLQKDEESAIYEQLNELCEAKGSQTEPLNAFNIGDPCLCKAVEDGCWYRAVICSFDKAGHVTVQYIDYGNREVLPCQNVKQLLKDDLMQHHPLSYPCILRDDDKLTDFTKMHQFLNIETKLMVHERKGAFYDITLTYGDMDIVDKVSPDDSFLVPMLTPRFEEEVAFVVSHVEKDGTLWVQDLSQKDDLDNMMDSIAVTEETPVEPSVGLYCCCKFSEDDTWYRAVILSLDDGVCVRYVDYGNTELTTTDKLKRLQLESSCLQRQALECCLFDEVSNEIVKYPDVEYVDEYSGWFVQHEVHGLLLNRAKTFDGQSLCEIVQKAMPQPLLPMPIQSNVEIPLLVTEVESNGLIWVQSLEKETEFVDLGVKIADKMQSGTASKLTGAIQSGTICIAMYELDSMWYRAVVTDVQDEKCDVRFVDYGNCATINLNDLYSMPNDIRSLPRQAVKCQFKVLNGVVITEAVQSSIEAVKQAVDTTGKLEVVDDHVFLHSFMHDAMAVDNALTTGGNLLPLSPNKEEIFAESPVLDTVLPETPVKDASMTDSTIEDAEQPDTPTKRTSPMLNYTQPEDAITSVVPDRPINGVGMETIADFDVGTWTNDDYSPTKFNNDPEASVDTVQQSDIGTWGNDDYSPVKDGDSPVKINGDSEERVDTPTSQNSFKVESAESDNLKDSLFHSVENSDSSQENHWADVEDKTEVTEPVATDSNWC